MSIVGDGSSDEEPYISYLKSLQAYLKSDGRILIAVDNRFGLKYFCGAKLEYLKNLTPFIGKNLTFGGIVTNIFIDSRNRL